ncbi:MAG: hypothetical protein AAFZ67_10290 [Planctomycetota bacterium]
MNAPTVYLERDPSGQALLGLRLIGDSDAEQWAPPHDADPSAVPAMAAAWLRTQLSGRIGLLCLDLRGAVCSWLDVPSSDAAVVRAAARQAPPGMWADWPQMMSDSGGAIGLDWRAASVQTATPTAAPPRPRRAISFRSAEDTPAAPKPRAAALGVSDLPVRLLLDELDRAGVAVNRVASLWHAMAAAWDPGAAPAPAGDDEDPLSSRDDSDAAVVLVTEDGRLAWAWSSAGTLLAAGTTRIDGAALAGDADASAQAAGRISADWLAWTSQLARSPGRVVCLADDAIGDGIAMLGRAIGSSWSQASIDLFRVPDPIGSTLLRLRETTAGGKPTRPLDPLAGLDELASRPGRTHKAMYRWCALAMIAGAACCVALGIQQRQVAGEAITEAAALTGTQRERVRQAMPDAPDLTYPALVAANERDRLRADRETPPELQPIPPILLGVEQIGFVVSSTGVRLERLELASGIATVAVTGPTTESVELLPSALRDGTDLFIWSASADIRQERGRYRAGITGFWSDSAGETEPRS